MAERGRFELPIQLPVCRISSAVLSTTQPPLQRSASSSGMLEPEWRALITCAAATDQASKAPAPRKAYRDKKLAGALRLCASRI